MDLFLQNREILPGGAEALRVAQTERYVRSLQLDPGQRFRRVHQNGINALDLDSLHERWLLSAGADTAIHIWDSNMLSTSRPLQPTASIPQKQAHEFGVSDVRWWHDPGMFTSSSYDGMLKVWDTQELEEVAAFAVESKIYSHAASPTGQHSLVGIACETPILRLCDLNSGAFAQTLKGHTGRITSLAWSPRNAYLLTSAGVDGTIRVWDIRRAAAEMVSLQHGRMTNLPPGYARAHTAEVNGLSWTSDSLYLVSAGRDDMLRVWDMVSCTDTLMSHGPDVRNQHFQTVNPYLISHDSSEMPLILFPNDDGSIIMLSIDGTMVDRFRAGTHRVSCITGSATGDKAFAGGLDAHIHYLRPYLYENEHRNPAGTSLQRQRNAVTDVYRQVMTQETTFS